MVEEQQGEVKGGIGLKPDRRGCRCGYLLKRFSVLLFLAILLIDRIIRLVNRILPVLKSLVVYTTFEMRLY